MNWISGDVLVVIALEVDEGDVFEFAGVVFFAPFGVAVAVGADAGAEYFPGASFAFEVLAEGAFSPLCGGVI